MAITARNLSKRFKLYARPLHRFREWTSLGRRTCHTPFWALRNVDLDIPQGASTAVVGPNGAGKSTLLKIITGTMFPTEGEVRVEGRVAALLELGTGFHPEFTGRLNIRLNGKMLGLSDEEIDQRLPEIVAFSELGGFIDQPIRTYSSGMVMRLGFAIASCVDPDVLIIDEALSVGDAYFSQKCVRRIRRFREEGVTLLFVSHDPTAVLTLCDQAVLLEAGEVQHRGTPEDVLDFYNARIAQRAEGGGSRIFTRERTDEDGALGSQRSGNFRAFFLGVEMRNAEGVPSEIFTSGGRVTLALRALFIDDVEEPTLGVLFRNKMGVVAYGVNTMFMRKRTGAYRGGQEAEFLLDFDLDLGPDEYSLTVALHLDESHVATNFDWIDKAWRFSVVAPADAPCYGLALLRIAMREPQVREAGVDVGEALRQAIGEPQERLDAGPECDDFFFENWSVDEPPAGRRRLARNGARFLFRPRTTRLRVAAELEGASEEPWRLRRLGGTSEARQTEGGLFFELEPEETGKLAMFTLVSHGDRTLRVSAVESTPEADA